MGGVGTTRRVRVLLLLLAESRERLSAVRSCGWSCGGGVAVGVVVAGVGGVGVVVVIGVVTATVVWPVSLTVAWPVAGLFTVATAVWLVPVPVPFAVAVSGASTAAAGPEPGVPASS